MAVTSGRAATSAGGEGKGGGASSGATPGPARKKEDPNQPQTEEARDELLEHYRQRVRDFDGTMKQIMDLIERNSMQAKEIYEIQWANKQRLVQRIGIVPTCRGKSVCIVRKLRSWIRNFLSSLSFSAGVSKSLSFRRPSVMLMSFYSTRGRKTLHYR